MKYLTAMYISLRESLGIYTSDQLYELFTNKHHGLAISRHRAILIQSRVFFFCAIFAVLVPLWSLIDLLFLPTTLWRELLLIRILSSAGFALLAWQTRKEPSLPRARLLLIGMLAITPLFYLVSNHWLQAYQLSSTEQIIAELYGLLPFVMIAGLTLFPLTLLELILLATPMMAVVIIAAILDIKSDIPQTVSTIWLSSLLLGVAILASISQLRYMLSQVNRASYDALTGLLTRRAGIEMLDLQFRLAAMNDAHLAILYLDIDHFKTVNDVYGHEAGDVVLRATAQQLSRIVRKGDSVIRWGGEEFIIILPTAAPNEADEVITRIMHAGLGTRPDGTPVTMSVGVAEAQADAATDWKMLIELADHRMYTAKTQGRARSIGINNTQLYWPTSPIDATKNHTKDKPKLNSKLN